MSCLLYIEHQNYFQVALVKFEVWQLLAAVDCDLRSCWSHWWRQPQGYPQLPPEMSAVHGNWGWAGPVLLTAAIGDNCFPLSPVF